LNKKPKRIVKMFAAANVKKKVLMLAAPNDCQFSFRTTAVMVRLHKDE
jgi:hypothetical protein